MPTHIEEAVTDVTTESVPEPESSDGGDARWKQSDQMKSMLKRLKDLELRTRAEGFDD
jgi:hypothetical protein